MASTKRHQRILVLGGGDGLAVRELLRYPDVEKIVLVDLDPAITEMARNIPAVRDLNGDALSDARVHVVNDDAMVWLDERDRGSFDVIVADFPDPNNFSLGKLYTRRFYGLVRGLMHDDTAFVAQSTSPLFARKSFWCVERSMAAAGLHTLPYHVPIPSFGEWGYVLAKRIPFEAPDSLAVKGLRYLNKQMLASLFVFAEDMTRVDVDVNRLNHQVLVQYYGAEWALLN